ncbi:glycine zipper 2TM domain-containing protein [Dyella ginsengisoli]|uniref:Glycine zipper 2TM domain-containing protein n=1 Tax=Dyella ginsengisoli TaxID=363848 RepID=A0ABW8JNW2_9GAMM
MRSFHRLLLPALVAAALFGGSTTTQAQERSRHQVCEDVRVANTAKDQHQIAGTAIGAVAGGLLGHQVGGGKGKTLATIGGAVAGGYAGKKVQEHHQEKDAGTHIERRCHWVDD